MKIILAMNRMRKLIGGGKGGRIRRGVVGKRVVVVEERRGERVI